MKYTLFVVMAILLLSCQRVITGSGKVVSAVDGKPLDYARVYWTNYSRVSIETDSLGNFTIGDTVNSFLRPDFELFTKRQGYETKYENFTDKSGEDLNHLLIVMTPSKNKQGEREVKETYFENLLKSLAAIVSLLNLFTMAMLSQARLKLKNKIIWLLALVFLSLTIKYNYYEETFSFYPLSFFIQIRPDPIGWYLYYIPIPAMVFWLYYFFKRRQGTDLLLGLRNRNS
ncbi:MAG TPA: hypothetical protein VFF27_18375 [Bacteroidia bacterium]|nr:hypothetical protein [Bacteroidia bacterium]